MLSFPLRNTRRRSARTRSGYSAPFYTDNNIESAFLETLEETI